MADEQLYQTSEAGNDNGSNRNSNQHVDTATKIHNRDWVIISIITIFVTILDKVFDLKFIIFLNKEEEWIFFGLSVAFISISTVLTSLFALQSFWVQSSQVPEWGSFWVVQANWQEVKTLHKVLSKPIHSRAMPQSSSHHNPFNDQLREISYEKNEHSQLQSNDTGVHDSRISIVSEIFESHKDSVEGETLDCSKKITTKNGIAITFSDNTDNSSQITSIDACQSKSFNGRQRKSSQDGSLQAIIERKPQLEEVTGLPKRLYIKQKFRTWVKVVSVIFLFTGILPEILLVINLVLYWKAKEKRSVVSHLLRDAWYVQTLKLSEAILESLPQIHLKTYYYLTVTKFDGFSAIANENTSSSSNVFGLIINAASICIGFISILHIGIPEKLLAFVLLFINLVTRILICAILNELTVNGMYFAPFIAAMAVSSGALVLVTICKRNNYRTDLRRGEKYIGYPILRTFCIPPVDRTGIVVSVVFVSVSVVNASYSTSMGVHAMVFMAILGQFIPGLCWYAAKIWDQHQTNKAAG